MARYDVTSGVITSGLTLNNGDAMYVSGGGVAKRTTVNASGELTVFDGGTASTVTVNEDGFLTVSSGGRITGQMTFMPGAGVNFQYGAIVDFDLTRTSYGGDALINDFMFVGTNPSFTLTVNNTVYDGYYTLAYMVEEFPRGVGVVTPAGAELGYLYADNTVHNIAGKDYTMFVDPDGALMLYVESTITINTKSDIDGNDVSDVMFQYTGGQGQIGFWMNGTNEWRSTNATHPATWEVLGAYDMDSNGHADAVLVGNVEVGGVKGAFVGYYKDGNDTDSSWVNISYLTNNEGYAWKNKVGNLTGNDLKNSIVWHSTELGALGAWTDGTDKWVSLGTGYNKNWTMIGCGDFDGDGRDSVLMSYAGGVKYYAVDIDGNSSELGVSDSGWEVRAIGDFSFDGMDDVIVFHKATGLVAKWDNGLSSNWSQLGQLNAKDWFVVGAGDYDGDAQDDLLVRQYSTGMLGYYSAGDMSQWNVLGYGVDMTWTVIA